jgi:hypothetical protein
MAKKKGKAKKIKFPRCQAKGKYQEPDYPFRYIPQIY